MTTGVADVVDEDPWFRLLLVLIPNLCTLGPETTAGIPLLKGILPK